MRNSMYRWRSGIFGKIVPTNKEHYTEKLPDTFVASDVLKYSTSKREFVDIYSI